MAMDVISEMNIKTNGWIRSKTELMKKSSHPDDQITAWELGVKRGLEIQEEMVQKYHIEKAQQAIEAAEKLFDILNEKVKIDCTQAYFKPTSLKTFTFLFLVGLEEYQTNKLRKGYNEALKLKKDIEKNNLGFNFVFKPLTRNTKSTNIFADGYLLKYAPKSRKTQSRGL